MFRERSIRAAAPLTAGLILLAAVVSAPAQERRPASRIDVEQYTIDAEISPNTQSLDAKAAVRFVPLDDNVTSAVFELNNALNVSKVVDGAGKQIQASRNQQDFSVRLSFDQPLPKGQPVTLTFYYDGQSDRTGRFAGLRHQVRRHSPRLRLPDVSGALVPGQRLHHRPVRGRDARHGALRLQGGGQRLRYTPGGRPTRRFTTSNSTSRLSPAASPW